MRTFTWEDAEEIALALLAKYPHQDPLRIRFTDLRNWVTQLEGFADDPTASSEGALESIQMAWWEEWKETARGDC
ncbi:MAG: Fe-S cluster assembly protein IscX [Bryobacteraceae bacterium]|jgi:FeS assembly protein IscX